MPLLLHLFIYLPTHLLMHLLIYVFIHLLIYLLIYLFMHLLMGQCIEQMWFGVQIPVFQEIDTLLQMKHLPNVYVCLCGEMSKFHRPLSRCRPCRHTTSSPRVRLIWRPNKPLLRAPPKPSTWSSSR